jgi:hypothetical protein
MLRLVGQMRPAVFQPGDPGIRVGRTLPVSVGRRLTFAIAVQADQVLGCRRLDATLAGRPDVRVPR